MVVKKLRALLIIMLLLTVTVFAGTTGKIRGKVVDASTGEPLAGATVMVQGTSLGAFTQADGSYFILQVPPGIHKVQCQIVGYAYLTKENVIISADTTTSVDFKMESKVAGKEEIVVQAKRPIVQKDNTASEKSFDASEIERLTDPTLDGVLSQQAGVVEGAGGDLHVRGGRSDEVTYIIDGIRVNNNLTGGSNFNLSSDAIQEMKVITGGFNAEYGSAMSGIVKAVTKSGQKEYHGRVSYMTSNFGDYADYMMEDYQASVSGPVPFVKGASFLLAYSFADDNSIWLNHPKTNFFSDNVGEDGIEYLTSILGTDADVKWIYDNSEPYLHGWRPEGWNRAWTYFGTLGFAPLKTMKVKVMANKQVEHNLDKFSSDDFHYLESHDELVFDDLYTASVTHTLRPNLFYEFSISSQLNKYERKPLDDKHYTEWEGFSTGTVKSVYSAYHGMILSGYTYDGYYGEYEPYYSTSSDEAIKVSLAATWQADRYNQLKVGAEYNTDTVKRDYYDARSANISSSILGNADVYEEEPWNANMFLQDKIEIEDMIVNIGFRYETYNANVDYYEDYGLAVIDHLETVATGHPLLGSYPEEGKISSESKSYFMPRLGLSYPLSDTGAFRFAYGHFYQYPNYYTLYSHINTPVVGWVLGNPELEAQKAIQYLVGFDQGLSDVLSFRLEGYFKEISDVLSITEFVQSGKTFYKYENKDFGRIIGFDLGLSKRFSDNWSFDVAYSISFAKGSASDVTSGIGSKGDEEYVPPVNVNYLDYDRRHSVSANLTLAYGEDQGFDIYGFKPLENSSLTFKFIASSGLPYTRTGLDPFGEVADLSDVNGTRQPWNKYVDMKFTKDLYTLSGFTATFKLAVENLFDWVNLLNVHTATGDERVLAVDKEDFDENGVWTDRSEYEYNLILDEYTDIYDYGKPRLVQIGLELSF